MSDKRITDPKKAIKFITSDEHNDEEYIKYGVPRPGYRDRGWIFYNCKALHPSVLINPEFIELLIDWKKNKGAGYGWGLLEFAKEAFPYNFLNENPKFIKDIITKVPSELIDSEYLGLHGSHGARINKYIPDSFFTLEGSQWLKNMYEKQFVRKYKIGERLDMLKDEASMVKAYISRKRECQLDKSEAEALKVFDSLEPKDFKQVIVERRAVTQNSNHGQE